MTTILLIIQVLVATLLTISILMQNSSGGLGGAFGSSSYHTKRGLEKSLFYATIALSVIYTATSLANLV